MIQYVLSELASNVVRLHERAVPFLTMRAGLRDVQTRLDQVERCIQRAAVPPHGSPSDDLQTEDAAASEAIAAFQNAVRALQDQIDKGEATVAQIGDSLYNLSQGVRSAYIDAELGPSSPNVAVISQYSDTLSVRARNRADPVQKSLRAAPGRPAQRDWRIRSNRYWAQLVSGGSYGQPATSPRNWRG